MKTVLVTGACGIVGAAVCKTLGDQGIRVIGVDLAETLPFEHQHVDLLGQVDLTKEDAVQELADKLASEGQWLDGLVNIAGGFVWEEMLSGPAETWTRMFTLNVLTTLHSVRGFAPLMKNPSSIVNIGAAAADKAGLGMGAYTASKSAVIKLSEALNEELRGKGVRVNVISPTIVDTPTNRNDMPDANPSDWVAPSQIAELASFLISDASAAINGENLRIRGSV